MKCKTNTISQPSLKNDFIAHQPNIPNNMFNLLVSLIFENFTMLQEMDSYHVAKYKLII